MHGRLHMCVCLCDREREREIREMVKCEEVEHHKLYGSHLPMPYE